MATYYWVGGSGTWDNYLNTHWSLTSGGTGAAGIPTSTDDIVFDANSSAVAYTVTTLNSPVCRNLSAVGPATGVATFAGSALCHISGTSVSFSTTGCTITGSMILYLDNAGTINLNLGCPSFAAIQTTSATSNLSLQTTLYATDFSIMGTLNTNNYNMYIRTFGGGNNTTFNLGSSNIYITILSGNSGIVFYNRTGVTINAGTSTINVTMPANQIATIDTSLGAITFNNVSVTIPPGGGVALRGTSPTFNNLTISTSGSGVGQVYHQCTGLTINGTVTVTSSSVTARTLWYSQTIGATVGITAAAALLNNVDFSDVAISGTASPASGTSLGDLGGNSGIVFPAPKTVYWNQMGGGVWSDNAWATTSGGTPDINSFPLAQDTCIIDDTGASSGVTVSNTGGYTIGSLSTAPRTLPVTFINTTFALMVIGNLTFSSSTLLAISKTVTFRGRGASTISSGSTVTIQAAVVVNTYGGSLTLNVPTLLLSGNASSFTHSSGNLYMGSTVLTCSLFSSSSTYTRGLFLGSSTITVSYIGTSTFSATGLTFDAGTSTFVIGGTVLGLRTLSGGGLFFNNVVVQHPRAGIASVTLSACSANNVSIPDTLGTLTVTLSGNNTFNSISSGIAIGGLTVILTSGTVTSVGNFNDTNIQGRVFALRSSSSIATLTKLGGGACNLDYCTITGIKATPDTSWSATNSTDGGSNSGWTFGTSLLTHKPSGLFLGSNF